MYNVVICIPTYKRIFLLEKLVISICNNQTNKNLVRKVSIVIVDNDSDRSAESIVTILKSRFSRMFQIDYHNYPVKGLSNVRNELLRKAQELNPDYIIFTDDDEYVSPGWFNEFVGKMASANADLGMGPVVSVFEEKVPDSVSCWFKGQLYDSYRKCSPETVSTANLILKASTLLAHNIKFDERFNTIGAEDTYFGKQLMTLGARCCWIPGAIVFETVRRERANIHWLVRRYFNGANTYTYILRLERQYASIIRKMAASIVYIITGLLSAPVVLLPVRKRYWGILKFSEGVGAIAGLLNIRYYEYK